MSNMSYCRFQNTSSDLLDCDGAMESLINRDGEEPLSYYELEAAKRLVQAAQNLLQRVAEAGGFSVVVQNEGKETDLCDFDFETTIDCINANAKKEGEED